ncbi:MAG: carboxymuconolactone decarboxylase, partial [Mycolicibacterium sp.]|nr:carboxymuconolactone decarboxylase [Mycolicibacterium sp.]
MPDINQFKALLEDPADFGTFGRFVETPVEDMPPAMREAFDFTVGLRGLVPGPHKIWAANPALLKTIAPVGAYYQDTSTLSKAEIEIATCVICGQWGAAYSNFEHEKIAVLLGKLDPATVEALIAGLPIEFSDPRQQVVYELSSTL